MSGSPNAKCQMPSPTHLIVGLGNPGPEYTASRHNVGFMVADILLTRYGRLKSWGQKFKGAFMAASANDKDFFLLKPQTFMNLSGESVGEAVRFHKLTPKDVIVFHDDLDLLPGQVKIKQGGGTGGHNGLKSLDAHISPNYWRVRIGIGHPGGDSDEVTNYVLGPFVKADKIWLEPLLDAAATHIGELLKGDTAKYLSHFPEPERAR
jgi:PTH1 family peptidyl-tRNA hydrolase